MFAVVSVSRQSFAWYDKAIMLARSVLSALFLLSAVSLAVAGQTPPNERQQIAQHERLVQQYLHEQRPDLAIPELKKIVALDPKNVEACANLGVLLFFRGDYADAVPQLQTAINIQPNLWKVRSLLGFAEEHTADLADARHDLEASFPMIEERKLKIEVGLDLVGLYTTSQELDKAANLVSQLKAAYPDVPEVLYAAYRTYADLSGESMLSLSLVAPDSAQMHQLMAHEETREGNTNGAIAQYRKAIAIDPHLPGVHFELAELLHGSDSQADRAEAEQEYSLALDENPREVQAEVRLGDLHADRNDLQGAATLYQRALSQQPNNADAALGLARVYSEKNEDDKALPLLLHVLEVDPSNMLAHFRLSTLYRKLHRPDDAKRELAEYQKYKEIKEQLRQVYGAMRIRAPHNAADDVSHEADPPPEVLH